MTSPLAKLWEQLNLPKKVQLRIMRVLQDEFLVGVTGIILNSKNEVLLVKHSYRGNWSFPGGYIKAGEHPKEGLEREIKEETNLTVSADERIKIRTDRETARLDITYLGTLIGGEFTPTNEVTEIGFFSFDKLPRLNREKLLFIKKSLERKTQLP